MTRGTAHDQSVEALCRAEALATGHDPDERIERVNAKPWPRWCEYRPAVTAALTAERATVAAAAVAGAGPMPQPAAYRDSPLVVFGQHEESTLTQMRSCMTVGNAVAGVICADGHLGYAQPVGGVIAYDGQISISGVGFDIGCGNMAVRLDVPYAEVRARAPEILADIRRVISFGVGRVNDERVEHPLLDDRAAWEASGMADYRAKAATQLGTVGSGNHYVDLMADEDGLVWIGVHFGSRGLGHTAATRHLKLAGGRDGMHVPPAVVDEDGEVGRQYLAAMELAGRYAYAGREWVVERVRRIIGGAVTESHHNHHNYCIAGDQIVPTRLGPKRMVDVRAGDEIYAFDPGKGLVPTTVERQWLSGRKAILRISTFNRCIRVSEDHPLQVVSLTCAPHPERPWHPRGVGALAWKRAGEIVPGDIVVCAEGYYETATESEGVQELEFARFIGAFLGDGWTRAAPAMQGHTVGLAIGGLNDEHTADYLGLVMRLSPTSKWRNNAAGEFGLTVANKALHETVTEMGIGATSHTRKLPPLAFDLSRAGKLALLAGYVDADGSVADDRTSNHGRAALAAVNRHLIEDLRELAISCGLRITSVRKEHRNTNYGPCVMYLCVLSAGSSAQLPLWHRQKAANQKIPRFAERQQLQGSKIGHLALPAGLFGQTVQAVESDGVEDVYDLTVSHATHSFVCQGMVVHNCWKESHGGRDLWVVRKGATPAFPGQTGFVGGSMGDDAVIVQGVDGERSRAALYSTVHGAGRLFGRAVAKRNFARPQMDAWLQERGVLLAGGDLDESPMAYRRLPEVLAQQGETIRVLHTLRPFAVAMAGDGEFDPFKD